MQHKSPSAGAAAPLHTPTSRSAAKRLRHDDSATDEGHSDDTLHTVKRRAAQQEGKNSIHEARFDTDELKRTLSVDDEHMILGIDEAGRGPVIGPMVYTGAMISIGEHARLLRECHVADSKTLNEVHRRAVFQRLQEQLHTFRAFTVVVSADEIAAAMFGRHGRNLNTVSHDAAIRIISEATLAGMGKLCATFVDTVGPPESYERRLRGRFPHLHVTVAKRADSTYPVVSAASIVAKVTRDELVARLGEEVGSGYPSDPRAVAWLRAHVHRFFVYDRRYSFVRQSWGPVVALARDPDVCIPMTFEQDLENDTARDKRGRQAALQRGQQMLSFVPPPPRRHAVYTHLLGLQSIDTPWSAWRGGMADS